MSAYELMSQLTEDKMTTQKEVKKRMAKPCKQARIIEDNRLVIRWWCRCHRLVSQGKRVPDNLNGEKQVIRAYVKGGAVSAIKAIRAETPSIGLAEAWRAVKDLRGADRVVEMKKQIRMQRE
jgi:hypothetical protein